MLAVAGNIATLCLRDRSGTMEMSCIGFTFESIDSSLGGKRSVSAECNCIPIRRGGVLPPLQQLQQPIARCVVFADVLFLKACEKDSYRFVSHRREDVGWDRVSLSEEWLTLLVHVGSDSLCSAPHMAAAGR